MSLWRTELEFGSPSGSKRDLESIDISLKTALDELVTFAQHRDDEQFETMEARRLSVGGEGDYWRRYAMGTKLVYGSRTSDRVEALPKYGTLVGLRKQFDSDTQGTIAEILGRLDNAS